MRPPPRIYLRRRRFFQRRTEGHNLMSETAWHTLAQMIVKCLWPGRGSLTAALLSICLGGVTLLNVDKLQLLGAMLREPLRILFTFYWYLPLMAVVYTYYRITDKYSCDPNDIDRQLEGSGDERVKEVAKEEPRFRDCDKHIKTVSATRKAERARVSRMDNVNRIMLRLQLLGAANARVDRRKVAANITRLVDGDYGSNPCPEKGYIRRYKTLHFMAEEIVRLAKAETDPVVLYWLLCLIRRMNCVWSSIGYTRAFQLIDGIKILEQAHGFRIREETLDLMSIGLGQNYEDPLIPLAPPILFTLCSIVARFDDDGGQLVNFEDKIIIRPEAANRYPETEVKSAFSIIVYLLLRQKNQTNIHNTCHNEAFMEALFRIIASKGCLPRACSFLGQLLLSGTDDDREYVIDKYSEKILNIVLANYSNRGLQRLLSDISELDSVLALIVQSREVLDSIWRRMTGGARHDRIVYLLIVRLLEYSVINDSLALQRLLGMGFLEAARYFSKMITLCMYERDIFRRVLNVHPEFKQMFRAMTADGLEDSLTARLGRSIPIRNPTPGTTYVLMGED